MNEGQSSTYQAHSQSAAFSTYPLQSLLAMSQRWYLPHQRVAHQIESMPLDEAVFIQLASLPALHRDPFDRILIAQALHHGMTLVTVDDAVRAYPVALLPMS